MLAEIGDTLNLPVVSVIEDLSRTALVEDEDGVRISEPFAWPPDFVEHWLRENYTLHYPVAQARLRHLPYVYSPPAAAKDEALLPRQRRVVRELAEVGIKHSIQVPVHLPRARVALVSWSTRAEENWAERALEVSCELMATAQFFMGLVLRREAAAQKQPSPLPVLSPRELECLAWVAQGKSDQDIATICRLSPATVRCYVDAASEKLDATTRTHAVALASELGLLHGALALKQ